VSRPRTRRFPDLESLVSGAAEDLADCVERAIREGGRCRIAMTGGSTPRPVYRLVAEPELAARIEWDRVHVFWGDERCVPPTDAASNYCMVHDELLARVPIPERNVHRIEGERSPDDAARAYAETLGEDPLDLVLLGMGGDGHTASLFPDTPGLGRHEARVVATVAPVAPVHRVSLTLRAINEAVAVRFWVSGAAKAEAVAEVFRQIESGAARLPAARVRPHSGRLCWLVDAAAAERL
jgi:6-phosphogluconolactonase